MSDAPLMLLNRTAPPSVALLEQVERCGLNLCHLPLVEATLCEAPTPAMQAHVRTSDWIIFCSPRAVEFAEQQLPGIWQLDAKLAAVGVGSARRINQIVPDRQVLYPDQGDGALALLRCPLFDAVQGLRISVVTGLDGLSELESSLRARGGLVQSVALYKRVRRALSEEQTEYCLRAQNAYVGSASFFDALMVVRHGKALPVWVPSERVAAHARHNGCPVDQCADSTDAALIARLKNYSNSPKAAFPRSADTQPKPKEP